MAVLYGMVYLGSALMAYNIYRYVRFARQIRAKGGWEQEARILYVPTVLLALFLVGYLAVALFGKPDAVVASILLGGSVFVLLMIVFIQRVTSRVQENERLQARIAAAEESSRAKTSFLSNMSHEMRTPMNAIIGLNNMALKDPDVPERTRERLEEIDVSAQHLLDIINDVLDMSRIESGKMELKAARFSLCDVLGQVNAIIANHCADKGLDYHHEVRGIEHCAYMGDDTKIRQVLINMLSNAVKYTDAPGSVTFTVEQAGVQGNVCTLRFTVADTGIGMDEDFLPNLFNAFAQEDATSTNRYGGTGLGMAITKKVVDMMGGSLAVESQKGVGSTFVFEVPLEMAADMPGEHADAGATPAGCRNASDVAAAETAQAPAYDLRGMRVLVAEDVDINAAILVEVLESEGLLVDRAANGREALERFEQASEHYYDAVLMDVRMPVMDGLSATRAIRALDRSDARTVPIVALTASAFEEDVKVSLGAGMDAHLSKPVDFPTLFATIGALAGR